MAGNLLSSLLGASSISFIDEQTLLPIWSKLKVLESTVVVDSDNIESPLYTQSDNSEGQEDAAVGVSQADLSTAKILKPIKVNLIAFVDDSDTMSKVIGMFTSTTKTLTIIVKGAVISNLIVSNLEFEISAEYLSTTKIKFSFETTSSLIIQTFNPASSIDSLLKNIGNQVLTTISTSVSAVASKVSNLFGI